jgi:hypothetical protein
MGSPKPAPKPAPPPALPTPDDPEVKAQRDKQRQAAQRYGSFSGTLLTGGGGVSEGDLRTRKRTLLGGGG